MTVRRSAPAPDLMQRLAALAGSLILLAGCASAPMAPRVSSPAHLPGAAGQEPAQTSSAESAAPSALAAESVASSASSAEESAPAPVPVDAVRPNVHIDLDDRAARVDLWARVRRGFAMPDLDSDLVRDRERWYASRPDYVARMTERGGRYLFHIVEELDKRGMPTELALLPFIESAFNPQAMSVASASGMWQFIPSTGRHFELKQNVFRDDRRDVLASTRAALDYLQKLHGMFGDWQLALAAYNWGEGNVQRAVAKNQRAGLPADYANLHMPAETQLYVPKLQAVKNIVARPAAFGLALPELLNHPYFLSVPIEHDMDLAVAVKLAGISLDEFLTLNPQMNRPVILAAGTPQILLPYDNANRFVRELPVHRGPLATWTAWSAPKTMKTAEAARATGMDELELREVNHIPARMVIKVGSTLLVPRHAALLTDVSGTIADNAMLAFAPDAPPLRRVSLRAGKRETVASLARRYRVSAVQVAQWNGVAPSGRFAPGQSVVVYVAARPGARHPAAPASQAVARTTSRGHKTLLASAHGGGKATPHATHRSGTPTRHIRVARN